MMRPFADLADDVHDADPSIERWRVLYDADCGFCKWLLSGLLIWDHERKLQPVALQNVEADRLLPGLTVEEQMASWHLISPDGERHSAGAALPSLLRLLPAGTVPAIGLDRIPKLTEYGYEWVAAHRSLLSRGVPGRAKRYASELVDRREQSLRADVKR
jgi:predicted DCC family thiol-disulfide oxidoreductase YuxK